MSYNQNSGYGQFLMMRIASVCPTFGRVIVVSPYGDKNTDKLQQLFGLEEGRVAYFQTLEGAEDYAITNEDDVILLNSQSAHAVADKITWDKDRIHVIGMGAQGYSSNIQGAKVEMAATVAAESILHITGVRNTFTNIKFTQASTQTACKYAIKDEGEGTMLDECAVAINSKLNATATADIFASGDTCTYKNTIFGNDVVLTSAARSVMLIDAGTTQTDGMKSCTFDNCTFKIMSSAANAKLFSLVDTGGAKFLNIFKNCGFYNTINQTGSAVQLTVAGASASGFVEGSFVFEFPKTNAASFATTSDGFKVITTTVSNNAFEGVTPA